MSRHWHVLEAGANSTGIYYRIETRTKGQMVAPVVVKHSTRHNTMVCLTCNTNDKCEHALAVRAYTEQQGAA